MRSVPCPQAQKGTLPASCLQEGLTSKRLREVFCLEESGFEPTQPDSWNQAFNQFVKLPSTQKFLEEIPFLRKPHFLPLGPQAYSGFNEGLFPEAQVFSNPGLKLSFGWKENWENIPPSSSECVHIYSGTTWRGWAVQIAEVPANPESSGKSGVSPMSALTGQVLQERRGANSYHQGLTSLRSLQHPRACGPALL